MDFVKTSEIDITSIHEINGPRFYPEMVEDFYVVNFSVSNIDQGRDTSSQIQEGMQLDSSFSFAKLGPREKSQTQIDGRGIQGVNRLLQIETEIFVGIKRSGDVDEHLSEIGINAPIPRTKPRN